MPPNESGAPPAADTCETPPSGIVRPMGVMPGPSEPTPVPTELSPCAEPAKKIGEYRGHKAAVLALDFTSDRKLLASASADGSVRLWSMSRQSNDSDKERCTCRRGRTFTP